MVPHAVRVLQTLAEFGLDPVARLDHAYAAHERTYTIAMAIQSRYYGRAPDHKYFVGCSGGGRHARYAGAGSLEDGANFTCVAPSN